MQRIRLLGPALVVLLAGTLGLAACNSSSSGTSQRASGGANTVTGAETPTASAKAPAKGAIGDVWIRNGTP